MAKPSEMWKKNRQHTDDVSKVLQDLGNMNRFGEIVGWVGKHAYVKMNQVGHSSIDFNKCRCKNAG